MAEFRDGDRVDGPLQFVERFLEKFLERVAGVVEIRFDGLAQPTVRGFEPDGQDAVRVSNEEIVGFRLDVASSTSHGSAGDLDVGEDAGVLETRKQFGHPILLDGGLISHVVDPGGGQVRRDTAPLGPE